MTRPRNQILYLPFLALTLVLGACSGGSELSNPTTVPPTLDVAAVLAKAGAGMEAVETLHYSIVHEGAEVLIDGDDGFIAFDEATGRFAAPSSADALVGVTAAGIATEVGAVAIDGQLWITNPLTGKWEVAPDSITFDPARIFSGEVGLGVLLAEGLINPELESADPDSQGLLHVTAGVDPAGVSSLTSGLVKDVSNVEVWVDAETYLVDKVTFVVGTDEGDTNWIMLISDYGSDVSISEPDLG